MAADHVIVTFTTDSKQLATTLAAEVTDADFHCCAHIEGPIRSVQRWHGRTRTNEEWRVEIEVDTDGAESLVDHLNGTHRDEIHHLVVTDKLSPVFDSSDG